MPKFTAASTAAAAEAATAAFEAARQDEADRLMGYRDGYAAGIEGRTGATQATGVYAVAFYRGHRDGAADRFFGR